MNSYSFNQVDNKYPALGIVTAVCYLAVAVMLQYTQKLVRIDRWLITFDNLKSITYVNAARPKLLVFVSVLYYMAALVPILLLIVWAILLFAAFGASPGVPVLFHGLFLYLLILPCRDTLYYYKLLGLSVLFVAAQLVTIFTSESWAM